MSQTRLFHIDKGALFNRFYKKANVLFMVCTHRNLNIDAMTSAMHLYSQTRHHYTWAPLKGDAQIQRARSRCASFLLSRNEDVLFFCDDDIGFSVEDVNKVVDNVIGGMDICGAAYVQKTPQAQLNAVFFNGQEVTFGKDQKPVEVEALPAGFLAIHRRVFEKMVAEGMKMEPKIPMVRSGEERYWTFFQPFNVQKAGEWIELSEDHAFCERAKTLGFKIWLDPSVLLTHEGSYKYDLADQLRPPKPVLDKMGPMTIKQ